MKRAASRWLIAIAAAFPLLCAYSCAVPLGPGYHIEKETVELAFTDQPQPRLHLDGHYRLQNIGNGPLTSIGVTLPDKDSFGRENIHITVDGKNAPFTEQPADDRGMSVAEMPFDSAWQPQEKKNIEISCDLTAGLAGYAMIAKDEFGFGRSSWFPTFQAPQRLFGKGEQRADRADLSLVLPKDFLAIASGRQTGRKTRSETMEYRFVLRAKDGAAFALAGRYKQQVAKNKSTPVYFWTFKGLPESAATSAGQQVADAAQFFDSNFLARTRGSSPVWVVEMPENPVYSGASALRPIESIPSVLPVSGHSLAAVAQSAQISSGDIAMLADTWIKGIAAPPQNSPILSVALRDKMVDAFYESRDGTYRQMKISEYLRQYENSPALATEKPVAQVGASDPSGQIDMAVNKAGLFLYALEDACGQAAFRRGIGVMLSDLRGGQYSYEDLRAALRGECGANANVDMLFRAWLYEKGIPMAFRERYAKTTAQEIR